MQHNNIRVVCEVSPNIGDDVHPDSRKFIRKYLSDYPKRTMMKLAANQTVQMERGGEFQFNASIVSLQVTPFISPILILPPHVHR